MGSPCEQCRPYHTSLTHPKPLFVLALSASVESKCRRRRPKKVMDPSIVHMSSTFLGRYHSQKRHGPCPCVKTCVLICLFRFFTPQYPIPTGSTLSFIPRLSSFDVSRKKKFRLLSFLLTLKIFTLVRVTSTPVFGGVIHSHTKAHVHLLLAHSRCPWE